MQVNAWPTAKSVDDVLERMDLIDRSLPRDDGVAVFNRMYQQVTTLVQDGLDADLFQAGDFLAHLDVIFANYFFDAYAADLSGGKVPRAWAPLFDHRRKPNTHPIQFALAGMNAHIAHDLPHAVIDTCRDSGLAPEYDSPQHRDYCTTNEVLESATPQIKTWFHSGAAGVLDDVGGRVDDALEMWGLVAARSMAWIVAETLWGLADNPTLLELFGRGHRRAVELTGRGILI